MQNKKFRPKLDKTFSIILICTTALMLAATVLSVLAPVTFFITIPLDLFVFYFLFSPLFGYVELREESLFIKFGFFIKREIPYAKIRAFSKERKLYSDSMLSLKNSLDHVNIKYNVFDVISVSVKDNDLFIAEAEARIDALRKKTDRTAP